jgi:hypothetical protein
MPDDPHIPIEPQEGDSYYNSATGKMREYRAGAWMDGPTDEPMNLDDLTQTPTSDLLRASDLDNLISERDSPQFIHSLERIQTTGYAPRDELMAQALAHYAKISATAGWWNSVVPEALRAWGAEPTAIEVLTELLAALPERHDVIDLYDIPRRRQRLAYAYDAAWKLAQEQERAAKQDQAR